MTQNAAQKVLKSSDRIEDNEPLGTECDEGCDTDDEGNDEIEDEENGKVDGEVDDEVDEDIDEENDSGKGLFRKKPYVNPVRKALSVKPGKKAPFGSKRNPAISAIAQITPFHIGPKIAPPIAIGTKIKLTRINPTSTASTLPKTICNEINIPHKIVM